MNEKEKTISLLKKKLSKSRRKNLELKRLLRRRKKLEAKLDFKQTKSEEAPFHTTFKTIENKTIFLAWNNLGKPFQKHNQKGKIFYSCIKILGKEVKKRSSQNIIETFDLAAKFFRHPSFKFHKRIVNSKRNISLVQFFGKDKEYQKWYGLSESWFGLFSKGENYVKENFLFYQKEIDPRITALLRGAWIQYKNGDVDIDNSDFKQKIVRFSNLFCKFSQVNEIDPFYLVDIFKKGLNEWHSIKLNRLNFALSPSFYSETIPEELKRYSPLHFGNRRFRTDWKEINNF